MIAGDPGQGTVVGIGFSFPLHRNIQEGRGKKRGEEKLGKSQGEGGTCRFPIAGRRSGGTRVLLSQVTMGAPRGQRAEEGRGCPEQEPCIPPVRASLLWLPGGNNFPVRVLLVTLVQQGASSPRTCI